MRIEINGFGTDCIPGAVQNFGPDDNGGGVDGLVFGMGFGVEGAAVAVRGHLLKINTCPTSVPNARILVVAWLQHADSNAIDTGSFSPEGTNFEPGFVPLSGSSRDRYSKHKGS